MYGNQYQGGNQGGYGQPQQQQQGQGGDFWPNVTSFKIGPNQKGTGHTVSFTVNAQSRSKSQPITFEELIAALQKAFHESGGQGVRIVLPFRQGNGPRGPFQSATIGIFPNTPPAQGFGGNRGGGRRQYPPRDQAQGYGQPQQGAYGNTIPQQGGGYYNNPPQAAQAPVPPPYAQQGIPQGGPTPPGVQTPATPQGGNGQTAPTSASPSERAPF